MTVRTLLHASSIKARSSLLVLTATLPGLCLLSGCGGEKPTPPPQAAPAIPPAVSMEKPAAEKPAAKKDDHDHDHDHEMPKTIEEAIAGLKQIGAKVEKELTGGSAEKADDLVHSVGHLIEDLHEKIAAAKLGEKAKAAAKAAADEIYDAYGAIDEALHAAEEEVKKFDFKQFAPKIEAATKQLEDMFVKAKQTLAGEEQTGKATNADAKPAMKPEPKPEKKAEPKPEKKAEPKPEKKAEPKAEPKPEKKAEPKAEPAPEAAEKPAAEAPADAASEDK
jgi:hypothetical protein